MPEKKDGTSNGSSQKQVAQFVDKTKEIAGSVAEKAGPAVGKAVDKTKEIAGSVAEKAGPAVEKAKDSAGELVGKVKGAIGSKSDEK